MFLITPNIWVCCWSVSIVICWFVCLFCLIFNCLTLLPGTCGNFSLTLGYCVWISGWCSVLPKGMFVPLVCGTQMDQLASVKVGDGLRRDFRIFCLFLGHSLSGFLIESWSIYQDLHLLVRPWTPTFASPGSRGCRNQLSKMLSSFLCGSLLSGILTLESWLPWLSSKSFPHLGYSVFVFIQLLWLFLAERVPWTQSLL